MHVTTLNIMALIAVIIATALVYWGGYMSGHKDGTDDGYASGVSDGKSSGIAEASARVNAYRTEAEQLKTLREIDRGQHRNALETIMLDCDERIATFARRANPFTAEDYDQLFAIAHKLELAANTFAGITCGDHARQATRLQQHALNMAERLRIVLAATNQLPAAAQPEGVAA